MRRSSRSGWGRWRSAGPEVFVDRAATMHLFLGEIQIAVLCPLADVLKTISRNHGSCRPDLVRGRADGKRDCAAPVCEIFASLPGNSDPLSMGSGSMTPAIWSVTPPFKSPIVLATSSASRFDATGFWRCVQSAVLRAAMPSVAGNARRVNLDGCHHIGDHSIDPCSTMVCDLRLVIEAVTRGL